MRAGLVAALGWGCLAGLNFLLALRLEDAFALSPGARGLVLTGLGVAGIVTARLIGGAVDRVGARRCVLAGALSGAVLIAGVGIVPVLAVVVALWTLAGVSSQLVLVGVNALVLGEAGAANTGGAMSVVQALRFGGGSLAPVGITPVYHADPVAGFVVPAALLAAGVPALLAARPAPGPADRAAQVTACERRSSRSTHSSVLACVASSTTGGATPARSASTQRLAHRHHRSPGASPAKPNSGRGVDRSLPCRARSPGTRR